MQNVALVGIGNIGLTFDMDFNDNTKCLSHSKALFMSNDFTLGYVVDKDSSYFDFILSSFPNCKCVTSHKELLQYNDIDLLVIATPTNTHYSILEDFSNQTSIKYFFIEKPLFDSPNQYELLVNDLKDKIIINYSRRFSKAFIHLKQFISNNKYQTQKIIINYCKGLKNNGSHMIDLINFMFDSPKINRCNILSQSVGFDEKDLCYDILVEVSYKDYVIPIYFISHNHTLYNYIDISIFNEEYMIKYINTKAVIEYYYKESYDKFPTYQVFSNIPNIVDKIDGEFAILNAYGIISDMIECKSENISSFNDELCNQNFYNSILKEVNNEISY